MRTMSEEMAFMIPGRPDRGGVNVHLRAINCRCHRRIVSGVTMVATWRKSRRPSRRPLAARRRRSSSVNRRRPVSCPLRTRFSAMRYSMTYCWWRLIHPARVTSSTCKGVGSAIIPRFYRARQGTAGGTSAEYSDSTGWTPGPNNRTVRGRLPFIKDEQGQYRQPRRFERAFYLRDDGVLERVQANEQSLGWPTARFELTFDAPAATP